MARSDLQRIIFKPAISTDVIGVQLGGAVKNIISLGSGMLEGLEFGENTKAAFLTHGMSEIIRLGEAMGADPKTFLGPRRVRRSRPQWDGRPQP